MHTPFTMHAPFTTHAPLYYACPTPLATHVPPWTELLTHACENITFLHLLLRAVPRKHSSWMCTDCVCQQYILQ